MEDGLSKNEFLMEDGHTTRDYDLVEDEIKSLISLKEDFIELMTRARRIAGYKGFDDYAISCEQEFDDALHHELTKLCAEINSDHALPKSKEYLAWLDGLRRKAEANLAHRPVLTNPQTYADIAAQNVAASKAEGL